MPGRPKKNHRRRPVGEAPRGKKLSKHGVQIKCGLCGTGHNKFRCKKNPERGKKKNAFLQKAGHKMKASEVSYTKSCYFNFFAVYTVAKWETVVNPAIMVYTVAKCKAVIFFSFYSPYSS
jgi:hypothetical protein